MTDRSAQKVGYQLKRTQHALRLRMDDAVRDVGLTTPQYAVLSLLETAPGMSNADLARRAFVTPQTMNAIVTKLETAGLLARQPHPTHGRVQTTLLTERARQILAMAHPLVDVVEQRMLAGLDNQDQWQLLAALRACASALEDET